MQSFKNYEVWIIDSLSSDSTKVFLKTLQAPFYWLFEKDSGIYDAMNKGVKRAQGDWLYFLGCDDRLYNKNTLESVFNKVGEVKEMDLIIGQIKYDLNGGESYFIRRKKGVVISSMSRKIWLKNTLHHQAIFYKKSVFSELEYSMQYQILSDYNLNINLFKQGVKELVIDEKIAICKTKGKSKDCNWKLYKEEIRLKTSNSSFLLKPVFYILGVGKYIIKKKF